VVIELRVPFFMAAKSFCRQDAKNAKKRQFQLSCEDIERAESKPTEFLIQFLSKIQSLVFLFASVSLHLCVEGFVFLGELGALVAQGFSPVL